MQKEQITTKQLYCMLILFILGSNLVTGVSMIPKQDSWISVFLALLIAVPFFILFSQFRKTSPEKDIYDFAYYAFGEKIGFILSLVFSVYCIRLASLIICNFTEFIQVVSLHDTPQYINAISIGLLALYTLKKGIEVFSRGCTFVLPVVVITTFILIALSVKFMDIDNLRPVLEQDFKTIFTASMYTLVFPFLETVVFISIFPLVKSKQSEKTLYIAPIFIGTFWLVLIVVRDMLVLGIPSMQALNFANYAAAGVINVKDFISRIEVIVSGAFLISGLVKLTVCIYVGTKGVAKLIKLTDYKKILTPIVLFCVGFSGVVYESTMHMFEEIGNRKFVILIVQVLIPLAILIGAKIKMKKTQNKSLQ